MCPTVSRMASRSSASAVVARLMRAAKIRWKTEGSHSAAAQAGEEVGQWRQLGAIRQHLIETEEVVGTADLDRGPR